MALPVTIAAEMSSQNYNHGPFIDGNGNVYVILVDEGLTPALEAWKATDPTSSFSEVDSGKTDAENHFTTGWSFQDGDTIHIISLSTTTNTYDYYTFRTSDHASADTWDIIGETIEAPADRPALGELSCSIVARSDGTVVVIYNGDEDAVHGSPYSRVDMNIRSTVPAWGGPVALDAGGEIDYFGSVAVLGESDKTHFFFSENTGTVTAFHRSLTSGDSLNSVEITDSNCRLELHLHGPGVYFNDDGTEQIRVPYYHQSTDKEAGCIQVEADDGSPTIVADIGGGNEVFDGTGGGQNYTGCFAVDGTVVHHLYSSTTDLQDLYHDQADTPQDIGDWGTDTEFKDAATINRISCNVIDRSGKKLAMVYDDGGTIMYDEKDIAVAGLAAQIANETAEMSEGAVTLVTRGQEVLHRPKLVESLLRGHLVH